MLAQHSLTLAYPPTRVAETIAAPDHPWTVGVDGDGRQLLATVGIRIGRVPIYKEVRLTIGAAPESLPTERLMLPVCWEAVGGPPLFPRMEGTIHVQPDQEGSTRLTLNARYDPPLGRLGEVLNTAIMHRVAHSTMKDFLERLAARLEAELTQ